MLDEFTLRSLWRWAQDNSEFAGLIAQRFAEAEFLPRAVSPALHAADSDGALLSVWLTDDPVDGKGPQLVIRVDGSAGGAMQQALTVPAGMLAGQTTEEKETLP